MSFERFSTSDIYMFEHVGGFIQCCGCWLGDFGISLEEHTDFSFVNLKTPREALAHLDSHEKAGHDIGQARKRIEKIYPDLDIEIEPYKEDPIVREAIREKIMSSYDTHPPKQFRDKGNGE